MNARDIENLAAEIIRHERSGEAKFSLSQIILITRWLRTVEPGKDWGQQFLAALEGGHNAGT